MIQRINQIFNLTEEQEQLINNLHPINIGDWDNHKGELEIYNTIFDQLHTIQNGKCCYCGLKYNTTGRAEIEHIAPKGARVIAYPEFSFTKQNLAIACQFCNSSSKKGQYNSISEYSENYDQCTFRIVHPYFDNPRTHYGWNHGLIKVVISGETPKGLESIRLFKLASPEHTINRAAQRNSEVLIDLFEITQNVIDRIKAVISYKRLID